MSDIELQIEQQLAAGWPNSCFLRMSTTAETFSAHFYLLTPRCEIHTINTQGGFGARPLYKPSCPSRLLRKYVRDNV